MLDKAFSALRSVYTNILAEVAEMCGDRGAGENEVTEMAGTRRFNSSNIALDDGRSNKHIRPNGEREN
jgi:hypothetical protein